MEVICLDILKKHLAVHLLHIRYKSRKNIRMFKIFKSVFKKM